MIQPQKTTRKGYGLFIFSAVIYTVGVLSFSTWSFFQQRTNLIAQVDQSLINATHATEQILGHVFIECAVEAHGVYDLNVASNKKNLDHFASDCRFERLGAIGYKKGETWTLTAGSENGQPSAGGLFLDLIGPSLSTTIQLLGASKDENIHIQTLTTSGNEELRVAIRYHSLGVDSGYALLVTRDTHDVKQLIHALAIRAVSIAAFLHVMAFPLILFYSRTRLQAGNEAAKLNIQLQQDFSKQKERETQLKDAIQDLERFNTLAVGREGRVIELKAEVNTLLEQMKRKKRYNVDHPE